MEIIDHEESYEEVWFFSPEEVQAIEVLAPSDNALVMNFTNAHHPGGGFLNGASAQEESLCRCSTLVTYNMF